MRRRTFVLASVLVIAAAIARADDAPIGHVRFTFKEASLAGTIALTPLPPSLLEPRTIEVQSGAAELALPVGSRWRIEPHIKGWWTPSTDVKIDPGDASIALDGLPAGELTGVVAVRDGERPSVVTLELSDPPALHNLPGARATLTCPADAEGRWRCVAPAVRADVSIHPAGFVPVYRWAVPVARDRSLDLGRVVLVRGASVSGFAKTEDGNAKAGVASARLVRMTAATGAPVERLSLPVSQALIDERGFFQLTGVPAGTYILEVHQPSYAAARLFPLTVYPDAETKVKTLLVMQRPLTLRIVVSPPVDRREKPWHVTLRRASTYSAGFEPGYVADAKTKDGAIEVPGQAPGTFELAAIDSAGNPRLWDQFNVTGPADAEHVVRVRSVRVTGKIHQGEKPLAATLIFGGTFGAIHVTATSDEHGDFEADLPRDGSWGVEIDAPSNGIHTELRMKIDADRDDRSALDIAIPDTLIEGRVVDAAGAPVAKAYVDLLSPAGGVRAQSGGDGTFQLRGAPIGDAHLMASLGARESRSLPIAIHDGLHLGPVELRFEELRKVNGFVASPSGPVAGARVGFMPEDSETATLAEATTTLDGGFTLELPSAATTAMAIVAAPGNALRAFEVPLDGRKPVLNVSAAGGTLELMKSGPNERAPKAQIIWQNGRIVPTTQFIYWAMGHGLRLPAEGGFLVVPDVAPGSYRVCAGEPVPITRAQLPAWIAAARCVDGELAPGGTLRLDPTAK